MFNLKLAAIIFAVAVPGIVLLVPRSLRKLERTARARLPEGKSLPPMPVLILVQILQSVVLVAGFAALGGVFAPRAGLEAPFFAAIAAGTGIVDALPNPLVVVGVSAAATAVFLVIYYGLLRPWLGEETAAAMDGLRMEMGLGSRLLYGGIVEEVLMRWGLMSLLAWLLQLILPPTAGMWTAIVITGVIFGLGHIPSYAAAGCEKSPALITTQIVLNLWAGVIFGYLFWQYGLLAAMVSHVLFHLIWYPIDVARHRKVAAAEAAA
jgi:hypothetical protein